MILARSDWASCAHRVAAPGAPLFDLRARVAMPDPVERYLTADHLRLDALLLRVLAVPDRIDSAARAKSVRASSDTSAWRGRYFSPLPRSAPGGTAARGGQAWAEPRGHRRAARAHTDPNDPGRHPYDPLYRQPQLMRPWMPPLASGAGPALRSARMPRQCSSSARRSRTSSSFLRGYRSASGVSSPWLSRWRRRASGPARTRTNVRPCARRTSRCRTSRCSIGSMPRAVLRRADRRRPGEGGPRAERASIDTLG